VYKKQFGRIINQSLRPVSERERRSYKWMGLINEEKVLVSVLIYNHIRRNKKGSNSVIYLKSLATDPEQRQKGYASFLLDAFRVQVASTKDVLFFCDADRVRFYEKRGAVVIKRKLFRKKVQVINKCKIPSDCVAMRFTSPVAAIAIGG